MSEEKTFIVETSAHHIHVTQETLEELFGEGATLGVRKMLSQPGQFASDKRLNIVYHAKIKDRVTGEVKEKDITIENMSILGPVRKENQVEISMTEARTLKAVVPVRESGDLAGSCPVTLVNPLNGKSVDCKEGMIIAKRHIHMTPADAEKVKAVYTEAQKYLEHVRSVDPDRKKVNWAYTLYQVYYGLGDATKTAEIEKLMGGE